MLIPQVRRNLATVMPVAVLLVGVLTIVRPANGVESGWPEFRGPAGQGISTATQLPTTWSDHENVVWKSALPGEGWSSPVLDDQQIFITCAVPTGDAPDSPRSLRAMCLSVVDGAKVWDVEVFKQAGEKAPAMHQKNSHASPTPVLSDGKLYVHFADQGTACLERSGRMVWRYNGTQYETRHGGGGSPILAGEGLVFSADGADTQSIVSVHRASGQRIWAMDRKTDGDRKFSFSTPLLIQVKGRPQIISPGANCVTAHDPSTGDEIWRVRYDGYSVIPRPVFGHGLVFISTSYDRPIVMAIRPDGQGDVTESHVAWTLDRGAPHTPSMVLAGDSLVMISDAGVASCVDAQSGKVQWQHRVGGNFSASPLLADGKLYFQDEDGVGIVVEPGGEYRELARNDLKERTLASYAAMDGALLIRGSSHLYRIGATARAPEAK